MKLKENCWRLSDNERTYFMKKYKKIETFHKVEIIHSQLKNSFEHLAPIVSAEEPFIVFQWINGRSANYSDIEDCQKVYKLLRKLHHIGKNQFHFPKIQLQKKWHYRLLQFQFLQEPLREIMQKDYDIIAHLAKSSLEDAKFPTGELTLVHGDVAHHNFLLTKDNGYIIDFDLAAVGHAEEELILWMQRLLPHFQYDLYDLLDAVPELERLNHYFPLLKFPNELLREWLLFYENPSMHAYLQKLTRWALQRYPILWNQI